MLLQEIEEKELRDEIVHLLNVVYNLLFKCNFFPHASKSDDMLSVMKLVAREIWKNTNLDGGELMN